MSAKDRVWMLGIPLLGEGSRGLLGRLSKTYGEDVLAKVLADATADPPIEPKAWIVAACEQAAKARPAMPQQADLLGGDPAPEWAVTAGFENRWVAENAGCGPGNFRKFSGGKRIAA